MPGRDAWLHGKGVELAEGERAQDTRPGVVRVRGMACQELGGFHTQRSFTSAPG